MDLEPRDDSNLVATRCVPRVAPPSPPPALRPPAPLGKGMLRNLLAHVRKPDVDTSHMASPFELRLRVKASDAEFEETLVLTKGEGARPWHGNMSFEPLASAARVIAKKANQIINVVLEYVGGTAGAHVPEAKWELNVRFSGTSGVSPAVFWPPTSRRNSLGIPVEYWNERTTLEGQLDKLRNRVAYMAERLNASAHPSDAPARNLLFRFFNPDNVHDFDVTFVMDARNYFNILLPNGIPGDIRPYPSDSCQALCPRNLPEHAQRVLPVSRIDSIELCECFDFIGGSYQAKERRTRQVVITADAIRRQVESAGRERAAMYPGTPPFWTNDPGPGACSPVLTLQVAAGSARPPGAVDVVKLKVFSAAPPNNDDDPWTVRVDLIDTPPEAAFCFGKTELVFACDGTQCGHPAFVGDPFIRNNMSHRTTMWLQTPCFQVRSMLGASSGGALVSFDVEAFELCVLDFAERTCAAGSQRSALYAMLTGNDAAGVSFALRNVAGDMLVTVVARVAGEMTDGGDDDDDDDDKGGGGAGVAADAAQREDSFVFGVATVSVGCANPTVVQRNHATALALSKARGASEEHSSELDTFESVIVRARSEHVRTLCPLCGTDLQYSQAWWLEWSLKACEGCYPSGSARTAPVLVEQLERALVTRVPPGVELTPDTAGSAEFELDVFVRDAVTDAFPLAPQASARGSLVVAGGIARVVLQFGEGVLGERGVVAQRQAATGFVVRGSSEPRAGMGEEGRTRAILSFAALMLPAETWSFAIPSRARERVSRRRLVETYVGKVNPHVLRGFEISSPPNSPLAFRSMRFRDYVEDDPKRMGRVRIGADAPGLEEALHDEMDEHSFVDLCCRWCNARARYRLESLLHDAPHPDGCGCWTSGWAPPQHPATTRDEPPRATASESAATTTTTPLLSRARFNAGDTVPLACAPDCVACRSIWLLVERDSSAEIVRDRVLARLKAVLRRMDEFCAANAEQILTGAGFQVADEPVAPMRVPSAVDETLARGIALATQVWAMLMHVAECGACTLVGAADTGPDSLRALAVRARDSRSKLVNGALRVPCAVEGTKVTLDAANPYDTFCLASSYRDVFGVRNEHVMMDPLDVLRDPCMLPIPTVEVMRHHLECDGGYGDAACPPHLRHTRAAARARCLVILGEIAEARGADWLSKGMCGDDLDEYRRLWRELDEETEDAVAKRGRIGCNRRKSPKWIKCKMRKQSLAARCRGTNCACTGLRCLLPLHYATKAVTLRRAGFAMDRGIINLSDVIVAYACWPGLDEETRAAFKALTVVLHDACHQVAEDVLGASKFAAGAKRGAMAALRAFRQCGI